MKIVIAMDSFKGSLSSADAGHAAAAGILHAVPDAEIRVFPVADGGEGTVDALVSGLNGSYRTVTVSDPLGRPIAAQYGILPDRTAVIEMAAASGLPLLTQAERDPMHTTTFGFGELIADAIRQGCRSFILGSAAVRPMTAGSAACRHSASDSVTKTANRLRTVQRGLHRCIISQRIMCCRNCVPVSFMSPAM